MDYCSDQSADDKWAMVNFRIQGLGVNINYQLNSLLSEEIDELLDNTEKLLFKDSYENKFVPLEEDFVFIFTNSQSRKCLQIRYYLDDNRNFIAFNINDNNLNYFYIYLQLVVGRISIHDELVHKYIETGIFQQYSS